MWRLRVPLMQRWLLRDPSQRMQALARADHPAGTRSWGAAGPRPPRRHRRQLAGRRQGLPGANARRCARWSGPSQPSNASWTPSTVRFLREPYAVLLVKEIESFRGRVSGFREPLSSEFRAAADKWLAIAQRQLSEVQSIVGKEPTPQVFRAGDPVDRAQEAFVPRMSVLGQLERSGHAGDRLSRVS